MQELTYVVKIRVDRDGPEDGAPEWGAAAQFAQETLDQMLQKADARPFATNSLLRLGLWGVSSSIYVRPIEISISAPSIGEENTLAVDAPA